MRVEVYDDGEIEAELFVGEFDIAPRVGETISKDAGGYFEYYEVLEIWHREETNGQFQVCVSVKLND